MKRMKKIAVLAGISRSEREISLETAKAILSSLKRIGKNAVLIDVARKGFLRKLLKFKPDLCYIACHGGLGENGGIQGFCKVLGIPYTSSGILASSICMNKIISKAIFEFLKINTAQWLFVRKGERVSFEKLKKKIPFIIKPANEGSTVGVTIVKKISQIRKALKKAFEYDDEVLIEKYIQGREFTVGWLAGKILPPLEIIPVKGHYDWEAKYVKGMSRHIVPAKISKKETKYLQEATEKACRFLNIKGAARMDFIKKGKNFYALEINTIPGMTETSLLPEAAQAIGLSFDDVVKAVIDDAA